MSRSFPSSRLYSLSLCSVLFLAAAPRPALAQVLQEKSPLHATLEPQTATASTVYQSGQPAELGIPAQLTGFRQMPQPNAIIGTPKPQTTIGSTAVGSAGGAVAFTTNFSASTTVTGTGVYTQGATGQDFINTGTGSCDTNGYPYTYAASTSCTTVVQFTPKHVGNTLGAEVLYTSTGSYFYGYVNGIGTAPLVTYSPSTTSNLSTLTTGLNPNSVAMDGAGDLWVSDSAAGSVKEFVPTGGVFPSTPTNIFTGFTTPQGIAFDGIGNLFVGDSGKGYIWKLTPNTSGVIVPGTSPTAYVTFTSAGTQPFFVALDPTDAYLYFIAVYSGSKYLIYCTITSGSCGLITTFTSPSGLAVDNAGNKYISDNSTKIIYTIPTAYNSTTKTSLITSGLNLPTGLALDAAGDLYVVDQGAGTSGSGFVTEYIASGGLVSSTSATRGLISGLYAPNGVTVDTLGNVYVADTSNTAVKKLDLSDAPSFNFADTAINGTSATVTVTLQDIGNTSLTFPVPTSGTNPSVPSQFSLASTTCPIVSAGGSAGTLAQSATCTYTAEFKPTILGAEVGFLAITDNSINVTNATQDVKLAGSTGGLTMEVVGYNTPYGNSAVPLEFTVGYGGGSKPTGTPTLKVNGSTTGVGAITCNSKLGHMECTATYNASTLAGGQYTILATQPSDGTYSTTTGTAILTITTNSLRTPTPIPAPSLKF